MRAKSLTLFCIIWLTFSAFSYTQDPGGTGTELASKVREKIDQLESNKARVEQILESVKDWDNGIIANQGVIYNDALAKLNTMYKEVYDKAELEAVELARYEVMIENELNRAQLAYEKLHFLKKAIEVKEMKEDEWEDIYFRLWNNISEKKERVDDAYIRTSKNNTYYGGASEVEIQQIRKRKLYDAGMSYYNNALLHLRREKDYKDRIEIEEKVIALLDRMNKLILEDTRALEKQLKKASDIEEYYNLIVNFEVRK